ncbi:MAG: hypothetical protein QXK80_02965 [Candidatus Pacearchaeota archaeon]
MVRYFGNRLNFLEKTIITTIIFAFLVLIVPVGFIKTDISIISAILTATTVLFGILAGFFIAATLTNYFRLQSLISEETAGLIALRDKCKVIDPKIAKEVEDAIDNYLIANFDYELIDFIDNTWQEFNEIQKLTEKIRRDTDVYSSLMDTRENLLKNRQEIALTTRQIIGIESWIILTVLALINAFLLFAIRDSSLISSIFTVLLSSATFLILFLLYDIDSNLFAEEHIAYKIYHRVFKEIGKLPYYTETSIKSGRVRPPKGESYRIGKYENFPKSLKKKIIIVKG